jgi:heme-degrading monooxygenase HmoA
MRRVKGKRMYVRFTIISGVPAKVDSSVEYLEQTARPQVEATAGNKGLATLTGVDARITIAASYWETAEALEASGTTLAPLREQVEAAAGGPLSVEEYEVALGWRQSIPARGAVVRLSRMEIEPARVDDGIVYYREETAPRLKGAPGLCSFQLLLDRESGQGMVATAWENERVASDFWPTAQKLRDQVTERVGAHFTSIEHYSLIRTSVQLD